MNSLMSGGTPEQALAFVLDTLITFYTLLLLLRALLALAQADFYNPLSQAIVRLTEPPLALARKLIPAAGKWDLPCWALVYLARLFELWLVSAVKGFSPALPALLTVALIQLGELLLQTWIVAIFIFAVSSWFITGAQAYSNPFISLLYSLTAPLLEPVRRVVPTVGPVDFSALVVLFLLYLAMNLLHSLY